MIDPGAILISVAGYILKAVAKSKTAQAAKEDVLSKFWSWLKPKFTKDIPEIEEKADTVEIEEQVQTKLLELIKDEEFFEELVNRVDELKTAGIREKNIAHANLKNVKKIRIGDKVYSPGEKYDRKNIFTGTVENAEEFHLGDG